MRKKTAQRMHHTDHIIRTHRSRFPQVTHGLLAGSALSGHCCCASLMIVEGGGCCCPQGLFSIAAVAQCLPEAEEHIILFALYRILQGVASWTKPRRHGIPPVCAHLPHLHRSSLAASLCNPCSLRDSHLGSVALGQLGLWQLVRDRRWE